MTQVLIETQGKMPARPLLVLSPLIKKDIASAETAADDAARPFYKAAGGKLIEAKDQMSWRDFEEWVKRNFDRSLSQAKRWMAYADATSRLDRARSNDSINATLKEVGDTGYTPNRPRPQPWHKPVKNILDAIDVSLLNIKQEEMKRAEEREAQRKLALQLIDIGYKALATKLHPDKGGSRDAMARLNHVRNRLRDAV